jgi:hypothetical protein
MFKRIIAKFEPHMEPKESSQKYLEDKKVQVLSLGEEVPDSQTLISSVLAKLASSKYISRI